jgi:uncharacterized membrane-anchored protein
VIAGLEILQVLAVVPVTPRTREANRPVANGWYWLAMLTAGTLGTAIGDCGAEAFYLGTGLATLVLSAMLAMFLALGRPSRWSTPASYWFCIVAVRAAGTTAGDYLAFPDGGLGLGLPLSTACTCAAFIALIALWRPRQAP